MKTLEVTKNGETTTTEFAHPYDARIALHVARNAAVREGHEFWSGVTTTTMTHTIFVRPQDRAVVTVKLT